MLKKFLLFGHDTYYPSGGWADFKGSFDTIEGAKEFIKNTKYRHDAYDLIDATTGEDHWEELRL